MIEHRPFETLGAANHGWLDAHHHFSFAEYHDPARVHWGNLRVWNDDTIAPGTGFPPHPHRDMEIITYVREGAITHQDNLGNKGRTASVFAAGTGAAMFVMYFFSATTSPIPFYGLAALSQFFFCGFNTAIYAIVPDCVEYGEWKTGIRNDGFQYAFVSLGNKVGMAIGTSLLAGVLGNLGFVANQSQNIAVQSAIHHAFSTIPGVLWIVTAVVLFFYQINKNSYNRIIAELGAKKGAETCSTL